MTLNSKKFKALKAKWDKLLANSGFKDIETADGLIKRPASSNFVTFYDPIKMETKQEYYRLAGQFLHDHKFADPVEQLIWTYHSEGMSIRNIVKELKSRDITAYRSKIHPIVQRLARIMLKKTPVKVNA